MGSSQSKTVEPSKRSTIKGASIFLLDITLLVLTGYGALTFHSTLLQLFCSAALGLMISLNFVVGHDAAHQSLTPHRWLNGLLGRIALLPSLHPFSLWQLGHNQTHHRWTNLATHDYVWKPRSLDEYEALSWLGKSIYRFHRSLLGPFTYYFFDIWLTRMVFPSRSVVHGKYKPVYIRDLILVWTFAVAYISFLVVGGRNGLFQPTPSVGNALSYGLLLPFAIWNFLMAFVVYLHHTNPAIRWFRTMEEWRLENRQSLSTVHVIFPGPINFVFHRIMEHNAHHERPSIPMYNLNAAQTALKDGHVEMKWSLSSHLEIVNACKLYDFEQGCWVDFSGNQTSKATKPATSVVPKPHIAKERIRQSSTSSTR